jgi:hypothetical protein
VTLPWNGWEEVHLIHQTFMCQGDEGQRSVFACEPIAKTALDLGIITSLELVHCADR